jgi:type VI secretion system protein ImpL
LLTVATGIFRSGEKAAPDAGRQATGRKVPQWVFLSHLFPDVVLRDGAALGSSSASLKTDASRRLIFLAACALSLFLLIFWIVSFGNNRQLANGALTAARAIPATAVPDGQVASIDSLEKLEALRERLDILRVHQVEGAPWWSFRWGLYAGDSLYPAASKVYFRCNSFPTPRRNRSATARCTTR